MHINSWPDLGTVHSKLDTYFEVSVLLKGEQNFILPSADNKQAVTPKLFLSSYLPLALPLPNTLRCNLKPSKGTKPKKCDVTRCLACSKLADHVSKDSNKAGEA